jgi:hypothetical protein
LPFEPIHWEIFDSREEVVKREKELKTGFGRKRLKREHERVGLAGSSRQAGDPITEGMIREIHRKLLEGVRGSSAAPGEYRRIQNCVVSHSLRSFCLSHERNLQKGSTHILPPLLATSS